MNDREFDVIVFGATGFVGKLTATYLAEHAPEGTRIALAGRTRSKLESVRGELPASAAEWPLVVADADSADELGAMADRTRVVCTTVGPYLRYGEKLVAACAEKGTDYVDLTGEVPFVRTSIDTFDEPAKNNGARIVHACGFDSVPSDIGAYALHKRVEADDAGAMGDTTMIVQSFRGGISGGTIDSMRVIARQATDSEVRKVLGNPHALSSTGAPKAAGGERLREPSDLAPVDASKVDPSLKGTLAPFFMASSNTRIVRRSNAVLGSAYGEKFRYGEAMYVGDTPVVSTVTASAVAAVTAGFFGLMAVKPLAPLVDRVLPKPGDGPSESARENGHFTTKTYTTTSSGKRYVATFHSDGDPGYKATARMLGESALTLALNRDDLPDRAGILTPASAMGDALISRLTSAGVEIDAEEITA